MATPPPHGQNPYAQQPTAPMGQQPGQPGVPQQQPYAPFPNQGGAPVPPPAPAPTTGKRVGKKALRIVILIVIALGVYGVKWYLGQSDAETTSVGSCMHNNGTDSNADLKTVDCSSGDAQYKVVSKFDNTSDDTKCKNVSDATLSYIQSGGGHDVVLCLKENK
ncbi:LppU/SCO3897 family protein [Streptomyces sp. NPDC003483]